MPTTTEYPHGKYPRWIGQKFDPDGNLLPFPGNTVICHLQRDALLHRVLLEMYDELQKQEFSHLYAFLPPTSWHMTIFEGVSDHIRKPGFWPADLPIDAPLSDCSALFQRKLQEFDLGSEPPFKMTVKGFEPLEDGIALKVRPVDAGEQSRLRQLRDRLSGCLQTRHPGHETYSHHLSISYTLRFLDEQDHEKISTFLDGWCAKLPKVFELGAPEFCTFDNMFAFHRQFCLTTIKP
ncbi:RNA ligase/cyclic nucleotide phosphodiesterase [Lipomyces kononenkoae]